MRRCSRPHDITTAQVLVTLEDSTDRRRYLNSRATLETLLALGVVPIVNENDTVATDEIRYGDNDRLAAQIAVTVGADQLILLSDVDGFYSGNPKTDPTARRYDVIDAITPRDRGNGGRCRFWPVERRHEDQADGRQDRHRGRLRDGDHRRLYPPSRYKRWTTARPRLGSPRKAIRNSPANAGSQR